MIKKCKHHGETEFALEKRGSYRCKKCRSESVTKRRKKTLNMSFDYKGGKCVICGYDKCTEALDFHHLDPKLKEFGISTEGKTRSWEKIKKELDKCVLLCSNCHREVHAGITNIGK